jgi:class 3 adenylate cyclase
VAGTAVITVLACDIVGSTALMTRVGDDAADELRRHIFARWRGAIEREGGEVVKTIGDAVMAVFRSSAVQAVAAAIALHDDDDDESPETSARVRVGIATGEAAEEDDDWFGTPVVEAFRLCARAEPGEILLSAVARRIVGSRGGYEFVELGPLRLKGLAEPVVTFALGREGVTIKPRSRVDRTRRRWTPAIVAGAALALGALVAVSLVIRDDDNRASVAAGVPAAEGYTPTFEPKPCPDNFLQKVKDGSCGDLVVPEDRTKPEGRSIRLAVTRAPARSASAAMDPIIAVGGFGPSDLEDPAQSPAATMQS